MILEEKRIERASDINLKLLNARLNGAFAL